MDHIEIRWVVQGSNYVHFTIQKAISELWESKKFSSEVKKQHQNCKNLRVHFISQKAIPELQESFHTDFLSSTKFLPRRYQEILRTQHGIKGLLSNQL